LDVKLGDGKMNCVTCWKIICCIL